MKKEISLVIFAGLIVGAMIGIGIWRANLALDKSGEIDGGSDTSQDKPTATPSNNSSGITLLTPEELDVVGEDKIEIQGLTKPDSTIVISGELNDEIIKTQNGEFKVNIDLEAGLNWILIKSIAKDGQIYTKNLKIIYSQEFFKN